METRARLNKQAQKSSAPGSILYTDSSNELVYLSPPGGDAMLFYDSSTGLMSWLNPNTNLTISGTDLNASGSGGGYDTIREEGSLVSSSNTIINFVGSGLTAADAGAGVTSVTMNSFLNTLATQGNVNLTTDVTGDLPFSNLTQGSALSVLGVTGNATADVASIVAASDHQILRRSGTSVAFGAINLASTNAVSGVLDETNGGTGQSTITTGDILYGSSSNTLSKLTIGSANSVLVSNGTVPEWDTLDSSILTDSTNIAFLDANQTFTGTNTFDENIILTVSPTLGSHLINIDYLNSVLAGQSRVTVQLVSLSNITLSGEQTIDGVLTSASRVLVNGQSDLTENGIYVSDAGAWSRAADMDDESEVDNSFVVVAEGTSFAGSLWVTTSDVTTFGVDDIEFTQIPAASDLTAGNGIDITALVVSAVGVAGQISVSGSGIGLATTGVSASTYGSATQVPVIAVDVYGRITSASNTSIAITSSQITDIQEYIEDTVDGLLTAGAGISLTYDDGLGTLTIDADGDNIYTVNGTIPSSTTRTVSFGDNSTVLTFENASTSVLMTLTDNSATFLDGVMSIGVDDFGVTTSGGSLLIDTNEVTITIASGSEGKIVDSNASPEGLVYDDDYSATFVDNSLITKKYVDDTFSAFSATVTRYYVEGSTSSTIDLDSGVAIKTRDGVDTSTTIPTNHDNMRIYRNGILLSETGSFTTRDYSLNDSTHVITLDTALTASEILLIEIIQ